MSLSPLAAPRRLNLRRRAWNSPMLLLTLTTLMWAGHSIVGRLAAGQIAPMTLTFGRWAIAILPLLWITRSNWAADFAALRPHWRRIVLMGGLGFTAFNAIFYVAARQTSALNVSLIQASVPAFVLVGAAALFKLRPGWAQALGALATMAGVAEIAAQGDLAKLGSLAVNGGDALMLLCCLFYAGYTLGLRNRPRASPLGFFTALALVAFATSIPLFAIEILRGEFIWPTPAGYGLLLYAAFLPALFSQIFFMRGVELIGPGRAGIFVNLVPIFGALLSVGLLGEAFAPYHAIALGLVVAGIAISQYGARA